MRIRFPRLSWPGFDLRPIKKGDSRVDYGLLPPKLFERLIALRCIHADADASVTGPWSMQCVNQHNVYRDESGA